MKIIERIRKAFGLERVENEPIKIEKAPQKRTMNTLFAKKTNSVLGICEGQGIELQMFKISTNDR